MTNFKEDYIFEIYKDTYIHGAKKFIKDVKDKYNLDINNELYKRIINYQIKKYGSQLSYGGQIEFVPKNKNRYQKRRLRDLENTKDIQEYKKFLERNNY